MDCSRLMRNRVMIRQWQILDYLSRMGAQSVRELVIAFDNEWHYKTIQRDLHALSEIFPMVKKRRHGDEHFFLPFYYQLSIPKPVEAEPLSPRIRRCRRCGVTRPVLEFHRSGSERDTCCMDCKREIDAAYNQRRRRRPAREVTSLAMKEAARAAHR